MTGGVREIQQLKFQRSSYSPFFHHVWTKVVGDTAWWPLNPAGDWKDRDRQHRAHLVSAILVWPLRENNKVPEDTQPVLRELFWDSWDTITAIFSAVIPKSVLGRVTLLLSPTHRCHQPTAATLCGEAEWLVGFVAWRTTKCAFSAILGNLLFPLLLMPMQSGPPRHFYCLRVTVGLILTLYVMDGR